MQKIKGIKKDVMEYMSDGSKEKVTYTFSTEDLSYAHTWRFPKEKILHSLKNYGVFSAITGLPNNDKERQILKQLKGYAAALENTSDQIFTLLELTKKDAIVLTMENYENGSITFYVDSKLVNSTTKVPKNEMNLYLDYLKFKRNDILKNTPLPEKNHKH